MRIKDGFILRNIANQHMAVPVGVRAKELHGVIGLNETGAFIWERLAQSKSMETIAAELCEEFDVDIQTAKASVERFCMKLREEGVIADE